ncbi:H-NS family nucleoid-associated regulatory protein [Comamonas testosteroni]|uniref:H-NS histone family protein n=1 Tax=Comamonas testosteroni TaxID=285 RepID=UPI0005B45AC3|nr:H-NS histone family protein [Comamonas testosteroni]
MTQTLKELEASLAALDAKITSARKAESAAALNKIHELVGQFGFTVQQLFPIGSSDKKKREPKYRDAESGATWTGIGKPPSWIAGKNREDFAIVERSQSQGPFLAEMAAAAGRNRA